LGNAALNLGHLADLLFQCHSRKKVFDPSLNGCVGVSVNAIHARRCAHADHARRLLLRRAENKHTLAESQTTTILLTTIYNFGKTGDYDLGPTFTCLTYHSFSPPKLLVELLLKKRSIYLFKLSFLY
jgi:hypothetical protein